MPFLGTTPSAVGYSGVVKQDITPDGSSASFTLDVATTTAGAEVFVNNVRQEPTDAYSIDGTTITFTSTPANTDSIYVVFQGSVRENTFVPVANTITSSMIVDGSITAAKIANGTVVESEIANGAVTVEKMTIDGHLIPTANVTYDLGSSTSRFRDLYLSGTTIELGDQTISSNATHVSMGTARLLAQKFSSVGIDDDASNTAITIVANGHVGIGTTTAPTRQLEVKVAGQAPVRLTREGAGGPNLEFANDDGVIAEIQSLSTKSLALIADPSNDELNTYISFECDASEVMRIKTDSNDFPLVGIGTINPLNILHLEAGGTDYCTIRMNGTPNTTPSSFLLRSHDGYFDIRDNTNAQTRMVIAANGNFSIGSSASPDHKLVVDGMVMLKGDGRALKFEKGDGTDDNVIYYQNSSNSEIVFIGRDAETMKFRVNNGTEKLILDNTKLLLKGEGTALTFETSSTPVPTIKTGDTVSTNALEIDSDNGIILSFEGNDNDAGTVRIYNKATDVATPYPFSVFANNMVQFNVSGPALPDTGTRVLVRSIDDRGNQDALTLQADYDRDIGIKWLNDVSNENWKLFIDGAQDDSLILTDTVDDYVFTIAQDSGHIALNPDNNTVIAKHRLEVKNGGISADYYVETSPNDEPNSLQASGALGKWVCMESDSISIGTLEPYTDVYLRNSSTTTTIFSGQSYPSTTNYSLTAGDIIWGTGPLGVVSQGGNHAIAPFSAAGQYFGFTLNRYSPTTIYVYPMGGAVNVNVYIDKGINAGSPNYTFTAYPGSVTTQQLTETTAIVIIEIQGGLALVTRAGTGNGDCDILFPASRYRYKGDNTFGTTPSTGYTIFSGTDTGVQSHTGIAFWHHDEPIIFSAIGDGNGGDTQTGMPLQCLGDTYIIPHAIPGYALSAIYPDTVINVSAYDPTPITGGWYIANTHSLSGSLTVANSVNVGNIDAGGTTTSYGDLSNTPMIFSANKPFVVKINDASGDEYDPVGYRQQHRYMLTGAQA